MKSIINKIAKDSPNLSAGDFKTRYKLEHPTGSDLSQNELNAAAVKYEKSRRRLNK
jgi:hypothetical protein